MLKKYNKLWVFGDGYFFKKSLLPKLQQCYTQRQVATPAEVLESLTSYLDFIHAKRLRT